MANTDKDILITPNVGSSSDDPKIEFKGADSSTSAQTITAKAYPTNSGTVSFEGSGGQLFSMNNSTSGTIFSVNDLSGVPSIEVKDTGLLRLAEHSGNVLIGTPTDGGAKLNVNGVSYATARGENIRVDTSTGSGAIELYATPYNGNPADSIVWLTSDQTANRSLDILSNIDLMPDYSSATITVIWQNGATAYYGSPRWSRFDPSTNSTAVGLPGQDNNPQGVNITAGNANSYDIYTLVCIKTTGQGYVLLASMTPFS